VLQNMSKGYDYEAGGIKELDEKKRVGSLKWGPPPGFAVLPSQHRGRYALPLGGTCRARGRGPGEAGLDRPPRPTSTIREANEDPHVG
jgi:hypothetical protein